MKYWFVLFCVFLFSCQPKKETETVQQPNILLIVADDLGYSDIGPFGGEIQTPVLDRMANEGMRFSNFYVLPNCSPTRSSLLSGNDNHVAGMGIMSEMDYPALHRLQLPGYSGALSKQVVTIPELLRDNNYHTCMVGKWHLGEEKGENPFDRGFEETFILGTGGGSHYQDGKPLAPPQHMEYSRNGVEVELPADFYSTHNYTDSLIRFIDKNKSDSKPFFAFLSYTAVHDPLHAPKEYIDKYKGKFDMGWDSLYDLRLNNLKALGIIQPDIKPWKNPAIPAWNSLPKEVQQQYARDMEVYAAMIDYMDMSIGRVFEYLKQEGLYDNTLIIFMSDNGANGAIAETYPGNEDGRYLASFNNAPDNRGLPGSYIVQGPGWAQASSAPFRYFKLFTSEGGIKAPLMVKMPGTMKNAGQWNKSFIHVTDIMPTLLELTGTSYPNEFNGHKIHPLIGQSINQLLTGEGTLANPDRGIGYEMFEMKAYIQGKWKILRLPVPMGTGEWELFDLEKDPGETTDLSAQYPDIKSRLIKAWQEYASQNNVHDHNGHYDSLYRRSFQ
ncbi:MAG: sulfatase-like hydrolase/transferase [Cyclobacteriaceae bacterium]|nr:sulfatase-like hydrolase/transferase [Cyclobacteriaceae bacterium]